MKFDQKKFVLYSLKAKRDAKIAAGANLTVKPNNITLAEIYKERNALRKQKV